MEEVEGSDSGVYTCRAHTNLDDADDNLIITVEGQCVFVMCGILLCSIIYSSVIFFQYYHFIFCLVDIYIIIFSMWSPTEKEGEK